MSSSEVWAVVNASGGPFVDYDAVESVEDNASSQIPTEPQENAALYAYDHVPEPIDATVKLLFSSDYSKQSAALSALDAYRKGVDLFTIITPARVLDRMAVVGFSTTRTAQNGATSLSVSVTMREVRAASTRTDTVRWSPKNPTSADVTNTGKVSAQAAESSLLASIFGG